MDGKALLKATIFSKSHEYYQILSSLRAPHYIVLWVTIINMVEQRHVSEKPPLAGQKSDCEGVPGAKRL
jgi:hypothetical protein